jgi:hypothetical protein
MLTIFRDGGFSMFFILGFGFVALGWAARYAIRGKKRPLGFVVGMMAATLFATASGICSDLGTTFKTLAGSEDMDARHQEIGRDTAHRVDNLLEGAGESMAPGIMGFSLLALTSFLLAVGAARSKETLGTSAKE